MRFRTPIDFLKLEEVVIVTNVRLASQSGIRLRYGIDIKVGSCLGYIIQVRKVICLLCISGIASRLCYSLVVFFGERNPSTILSCILCAINRGISNASAKLWEWYRIVSGRINDIIYDCNSTLIKRLLRSSVRILNFKCGINARLACEKVFYLNGVEVYDSRL